MPDHDLHLTGDEKADRLLSTNPLTLVVGMLLDQQVPARGPKRHIACR